MEMIMKIKGYSDYLVLHSGGWCKLIKLDYASVEYNLINRVGEL